jgi:hypothetical protein
MRSRVLSDLRTHLNSPPASGTPRDGDDHRMGPSGVATPCRLRGKAPETGKCQDLRHRSFFACCQLCAKLAPDRRQIDPLLRTNLLSVTSAIKKGNIHVLTSCTHDHKPF